MDASRGIEKLASLTLCDVSVANICKEGSQRKPGVSLTTRRTAMEGPPDASSAIHDPLGLVAIPLAPMSGPTDPSLPFHDAHATVTANGTPSAAVVTGVATIGCAAIGLLVVVGLVVPARHQTDLGASSASRTSNADAGRCVRTITHLSSARFASHSAR
jgi:hypothetical protein